MRGSCHVSLAVILPALRDVRAYSAHRGAPPAHCGRCMAPARAEIAPASEPGGEVVAPPRPRPPCPEPVEGPRPACPEPVEGFGCGVGASAAIFVSSAAIASATLPVACG